MPKSDATSTPDDLHQYGFYVLFYWFCRFFLFFYKMDSQEAQNLQSLYANLYRVQVCILFAWTVHGLVCWVVNLTAYFCPISFILILIYLLLA